MNRVGPRISGGSGQRTVFRCRSSAASHVPSTTANGDDLAAEGLPPYTLAPFELVSPAHVQRQSSGCSDHLVQPWKREEETEGKKEREAAGKEEGTHRRERGKEEGGGASRGGSPKR